MGRQNLVHKKVRNAKSNDLIAFQVRLPAYLLKNSVKTYGSTTKVIRAALEMAQGCKHINNLKELLAEIRKNLELLEEDKTQGMLDQVHVLLIETYRDIYFRLKDAEILKRRRKAIKSYLYD